MRPCIIYTTFASLEDGRKITDMIISEGLAACANLFPSMESSYMWEGKLERSTEVACILKTSAEMEAKLTDRLAEIQPYEVPCILSILIQNGHMPYISWLAAGCNASG